MPRQTERLSAIKVAKVTAPGMHCDGGGLYLQVSEAGTKSWIFRYAVNHQERAMGLGPIRDVSLAEARELARECRKLKREGIDPLEDRKSNRLKAQLEAARAVTFKTAAEACMRFQAQAWKNLKHQKQWPRTLATYVYPILGDIPVQDVSVDLILQILEPIWTIKPETANRVRQRIEKILSWSTSRGYRQGKNPACWRGHLENILPSQAKHRNLEHHPALPYLEVSAFMKALRARDAIAARAWPAPGLSDTRLS